MTRRALRYLGHRPGASLGYFAGAMTLVPGETFEVGSTGLVMGRRASADLRVGSSQVAGHHARIEPHPEGLLVSDLRSTNGTQVNGARVTSALVKPGDRLTLADAFDFEIIDV